MRFLCGDTPLWPAGRTGGSCGARWHFCCYRGLLVARSWAGRWCAAGLLQLGWGDWLSAQDAQVPLWASRHCSEGSSHHWHHGHPLLLEPLCSVQEEGCPFARLAGQTPLELSGTKGGGKLQADGGSDLTGRLHSGSDCSLSQLVSPWWMPGARSASIPLIEAAEGPASRARREPVC